MFDKAMTTNTAEMREESGKDPEPIDAEAIFHAATLVAEAARGLADSRGRYDWITLMEALGSLAAEHAMQGDPAPCFTADRLRKQCAEIDSQKGVYWESDDDTGRKKFSVAWKNLSQMFPGLEGNLRQRAGKSRKPYLARLGEQKDEIDRRNGLFFLRAEQIEIEPSRGVCNFADMSTASGGSTGQSGLAIEYVEEMEVYPVPWLRRPLRFHMHGWRVAFLLLPIIASLAFAGFAGWLLLSVWLSKMAVRDVLQITVMVGFIGGMVAWLVWPLYRLVDQRVVMAPAFLQLAIPLSHLLLLRTEDECKVLRMVRFTARCPLCDGIVDIEAGKGQFRGRYVGVCGRNAVEHVFSFDHVLRRGRHLLP